MPAQSFTNHKIEFKSEIIAQNQGKKTSRLTVTPRTGHPAYYATGNSTVNARKLSRKVETKKKI